MKAGFSSIHGRVLDPDLDIKLEWRAVDQHTGLLRTLQVGVEGGRALPPGQYT